MVVKESKRAAVIRLICMILCVLLIMTALPASSFGTEEKTDKDQYEKSEQITFKKSYFMESSFTDNIHLARLSAQTSLVSASYFDPGEDPRQLDPSMNARNITYMLQDKGFLDVEANKYYSVEELENSIGVVVGHMSLKQDGKPYTLLAVVPRSVAYKQEWAGNFYVGGGDIHSGFKEARDEVLRFMRKYVAAHGISGDLKIWISGHSRGAAVANMVGGFFADGGADYLGSGIKISPEDIYSYGFAAPSLIRNGAARSEVLSVAGARGGRYANDTNGEAFISGANGTVDPKADKFGGMKNYKVEEDLITRVPGSEWGLTYYGKTELANKGCSWDEMMEQLKTVQPRYYTEYQEGAASAVFGNYAEYQNSADPAGFRYYTYDMPSMKIIPTEKTGTFSEFLDERISTVTELIPSNAYYSETGYQDAFVALGGIYGLLLSVNLDYLYGGQVIDPTEFSQSLILFLSCASESVIEEYRQDGADISEAEALGIVLERMGNYMSGVKVPENPTVDYMVLALTEFIAQNPDSEAVDTLIAQLAGNIDEDTREILLVFTPTSKWKSTSNEDALKNMLIACARGPKSGAPARIMMKDGAAVRQKLYENATSVLSDYPQIAAALNGGNGSLTDLAAAFIDVLTSTTDGNGNKVSRTLGEAADAGLAEVVRKTFDSAASKAQELYGPEYPDYYNDAKTHISAVISNITCVRRVITQLLFGNTGKTFSVGESITNASTFIVNSNMIMPAHNCESYVSWLLARAAKTQDKYAPDVKSSQNLKVTVTAKTVKKAKLKKKKLTVSPIRVKKAYGKVTYAKKSGSGRLALNKKNGKITVKKATKKGTYKIKVVVSAAGNDWYEAAKETVTVRIRVK